jgi:hypothetical protein
VDRQERVRTIKALCEKHGCGEKQRLRHYELFVDKGWNVHPSERFAQWWFRQDEYKASQDSEGIGTSAITASHAARIWNAYLEAKQLGLA